MSDTGLSGRECRWDLNPILSNADVQCHCLHATVHQAWREECRPGCWSIASSSRIAAAGYLT